jgi:hypothetical protein
LLQVVQELQIGGTGAGLAYPAIATKSTLVGRAPALHFARIVLCETIE